ncbi:hypothetical protein QTP88_016238 [Uroleucon formosanum]
MVAVILRMTIVLTIETLRGPYVFLFGFSITIFVYSNEVMIDDKTLGPHSCVLACQRFFGAHTFDKIGEIMVDIFSKFNLSNDNIVSTVTDNGSNFVKAFNEFDCKMKTSNNDSDTDSDGGILYINYFIIIDFITANGLLATTDFQNILKNSNAKKYHHPVLSKCSTLWNLSRKPKSSEVISNIINCSLIYSVITKWNSLYDSISQLIKHKAKLNTSTRDLGLKYQFNETDISYLTEFVFRLQLLKEQHLRYTFKVIDPLITSLEKRFKLYFDLSPEVDEAILASCFYPTFKLRWIPEHDEIMKNRVKNLCINIAEKYIENSSHTQSSVDNVDDEDFLIFSSQEQSFDSSANLEVVQFFNNKIKALTCLDSYPTIKKLFIRYNTSLPSSAPVERLFSFARFIHAPNRSNLSNANFEKLVFLKGNDIYR